jgi:ABC-type multidrug transport system permease subunit
MVDMIDALYTATNSPLVMAIVTAIFAATATLLAFMAVIKRQPMLSWMSIFLFTLASTAMFFSLVRTEPDRQTLCSPVGSWLQPEMMKGESAKRKSPRREPGAF